MLSGGMGRGGPVRAVVRETIERRGTFQSPPGAFNASLAAGLSVSASLGPIRPSSPFLSDRVHSRRVRFLQLTTAHGTAPPFVRARPRPLIRSPCHRARSTVGPVVAEGARGVRFDAYPAARRAGDDITVVDAVRRSIMPAQGVGHRGRSVGALGDGALRSGTSPGDAEGVGRSAGQGDRDGISLAANARGVVPATTRVACIGAFGHGVGGGDAGCPP